MKMKIPLCKRGKEGDFQVKKEDFSSFPLYFRMLIFGLAIFYLPACAVSSTNTIKSDPTQIPALEPKAILKFPDIPTPSAFNFIPEESYAFESNNFRLGLLKYKGKASGDQVIVFFKEQMPMYNWHLVNVVEYGKRMLNFEKESESCIITVDGKGNKSEIMISITPKSQIIAKKSDKPIK